MKGYWQRERPTTDGWYWTATREGKPAGLKSVLYLSGKCIFAGGHVNSGADFCGWWWSEPVEGPPDPPTESF